MQFDEKVLTAFEVLTDAAENDFELFRICTLVRDLISPPKVEQVDENHQRFDGTIYYKGKNRHYARNYSIHQAVWRYYHGDIPSNGGMQYDIHHDDFNPENNNVSNLVLLTRTEHIKIHNEFRENPYANAFTKKYVCKNCGREFSALNIGTHFYCSKKCQKAAYYKRTVNYSKVCVVCGKLFIAKTKNAQTCSQACAGILRWKNLPRYKHVMKICPICGKEFDSDPTNHHHDNKTCSPECGAKLRGQNQMKRIMKTCPICGKTFSTPLSTDAKTCSKECGVKLAAQTRTNDTVVKTCPVCGKSFTPKNIRQICCSAKCKYAWKYRNSKSKQPTRKCVICGKEFQTIFSNTRTCSQKCSRELIRQNRQREKESAQPELPFNED